MSAGLFIIVWLLGCAVVFGGIAAGLNCARVSLFVLRMVNAPVYVEARMIAGMIYQHPEQWDGSGSSYRLQHPRVGTIRASYSANGLEMDGPYGHWEPNAIERLILWDAVQWYRHDYIKSLLRKEIV